MNNTTIYRSQTLRIALFAAYSIAYEMILFGIFAWAVFILHNSGWWMLLAVFMSGCQLKTKHFGIHTEEKP
jgi:hypothetical protein